MKKRKNQTNKQGKQGQIMGMSFQFIFSIIMIAIVLFVAFWAIRHFMNVAEQGKILSFKKDFETRVNSLWKSAYEVNTTYQFSVSSKIKWVCFANATDATNCSVPQKVEKDRCLEEYCYADFCDDTYEEYNLFLLPLGMAEKYNAPSSFTIKCAGKNCLDFVKNAECIAVEDGKVRVRFEKGGEVPPGKVRVSAP